MIANLLTTIRLLLAVPTAYGIAFPEAGLTPLLFGFVLLAIFSDLADGAAAKHFNTSSSFGQRFDHTTDFLFVVLCLTATAFSGSTTPLLPIFIAAAFGQYVLDSRQFDPGGGLRMNYLGRINGILYFAPIVMVVIGRDPYFSMFGALSLQLAVLTSYTLVLTTALSMIHRWLAAAGDATSVDAGPDPSAET